MGGIVRAFFDEICSNNIEVYNEFSFQHELGIYLRSQHKNRKVQFERNVLDFGWNKKNFVKKEIDISIIEENGKPDTAIELKYPRNGQFPEQMYNFCKDVLFAEQLCDAGFREAFAIILVEHEGFYSGNRKNGIYQYFREEADLTGMVKKPTGNKREGIRIRDKYKIDWQQIRGKLKYALVHVK